MHLREETCAVVVEQLKLDSQMRSFFQELKRRKVYRVAVAYAIAAGGTIQLASAIFPAWDLPAWSLRLVIVLLLAGFPIALVLGWAFDVTPAGIQATRNIATAQPGAAASGHRRRYVFLLIGAGLAIAVAAGFFLLPRVTARKLDKSIAVLPFENYSDDKSNAYFADGIQDDILTALSRIGDLKVISRTSVMSYRNSSKNVRDIGKALGAAAILEGSVRSDGKRVRVNVQLINAENDQHIWANEYDRDLTDVFAIQSSLAHEIADALQARLSPSEEARMTRSPTDNGEAYLAFVQARDLHSSLEDRAKLEQADQLYQRALQLDPNFALAAASLSMLQSWFYHTWDAVPARRDQARELAKRAVELQPELPEAHLALGYFYYYGTGDFDAALEQLAIARKGLPNSVEVTLLIGGIQRRQGNWAESNANLEKAVALSPKDAWALQNLAMSYEMQRRYADAEAAIDRAIKAKAPAFHLLEIKARMAVERSGDLSVARKCFEVLNASSPDEMTKLLLAHGRAQMLMFERKFQEAANLLKSLPEAELAKSGMLINSEFMLGSALRRIGDEPGARAAFEKVRKLIEAEFAQGRRSVDTRSAYAMVLASLGEKERAISESDAAGAELPLTKDAFHGPDILSNAALVYALVGDRDRAIATLEQLSKIPSLITPSILKLDPAWDSLRDDPRFQRLLTIQPAHSA